MRRWVVLGFGVLVGCSDPVSPDPTALGLELVADGFDAPVFVTAPPGDEHRLFVVERAGRVRIVRDGQVLAEPFLDLRSVTASGGERGLLSIAFDPQYASNGRFFVYHTDLSGDVRVARYVVSADPDRADAGSGGLVLSQAQPYANHNGGQLAFGPDGMLYVGFGDGGSAGDPQGHGQDPATLLGSLLRIDVGAALPYAVPGDNPFVGDPDVRPETWAYGLRNPWRFSFDAVTGDLFIGDVGQNAREEISFVAAGSGGGDNFGWNRMEGTACYSPSTGCNPAGLTPPIHEYGHDEGCSVTGGYVYRGNEVPGLEGRYVYGDYCSGFIRSFRLEGGAAVDVLDHTDALGVVPQLTSFGVDGVGELYVVSLEGSVHRIVGR